MMCPRLSPLAESVTGQVTEFSSDDTRRWGTATFQTKMKVDEAALNTPVQQVCKVVKNGS